MIYSMMVSRPLRHDCWWYDSSEPRWPPASRAEGFRTISLVRPTRMMPSLRTSVALVASTLASSSAFVGFDIRNSTLLTVMYLVPLGVGTQVSLLKRLTSKLYLPEKSSVLMVRALQLQYVSL